jgi:hypothetical protein
MRLRTFSVLALAAIVACGDHPTEPVLSAKGFVLSVLIPGVTDTTLLGDSLSWFYISGPDSVLGRRQELTLELLVLDPPPPLQSPLQLKTRWYHVPNALPDARSYDLTGDGTGGVYLEANSNVGTWASTSGHIRLSEVTDTSLKGDIQATLTQVYPEQRYLPDVELRATFWAPHTLDGRVD